jgi:3-deoxy-D-manno-octulosonate 8-phosphate phosphatase (KDO 8-P phosphatase)
LARSLKLSPALKKRAGQIALILMDVDGTMTDGSVTLLSQPDGTAITGRESAALLRRAKEMKMEFIYMKQPVKMPAYEEILRKAGVADAAVAYVGDDLPDIPILRRAGLAVAVGDAVPEVKKVSHYTTRAHAGHGAIREVVELVLKSKGIWEAMLDKARA